MPRLEERPLAFQPLLVLQNSQMSATKIAQPSRKLVRQPTRNFRRLLRLLWFVKAGESHQVCEYMELGWRSVVEPRSSQLERGSSRQLERESYWLVQFGLEDRILS